MPATVAQGFATHSETSAHDYIHIIVQSLKERVCPVATCRTGYWTRPSPPSARNNIYVTVGQGWTNREGEEKSLHHSIFFALGGSVLLGVERSEAHAGAWPTPSVGYNRGRKSERDVSGTAPQPW